MQRLQSWSLAGIGLVMLALALAPAPASAAPNPPELGVLLFPKAHYQGTPRRYTLKKGEAHATFNMHDWRAQNRNRTKVGSIRVGRRAGVLLQDGQLGGPMDPSTQAEVLTRVDDDPDLGDWKGRIIRHIVVFVSAVDGQQGRGQLVRVRDHPDGAEFGLYRAAHVQGGSSPRLPEVFVTSDPRTPEDEWWTTRQSLYQGVLQPAFLWKGGFHWLRVYGAQTVVTITAKGNHRWDFHTHGKRYAEYDLNKFMKIRRATSIVVRPRDLRIVPSKTTGLLSAKAAARDYWVYRGGHFIKMAGNAWEVYAQGRKVFSLREVRRTKELVELRSTTHALRIRLRGDSSWVLDPKRGASKWQKQYTGRWRERPRGAVVKPGRAPVVPTPPAAILRQVPKVIGLTRKAADKTIRAVGLVPTFQRLPGASGGSTEVVAQSPTGGATLAAGSRVLVRYRDLPGTREPAAPGPQAKGPAARTYWTYSGGHFIKMPNGTWDVYAGGRKVFSLREERRTKDFVLLHSPANRLRVRLQANASFVLDPNRGASNWTKQYDGKWSAHPGGG